jgi:hypothetical protein
VSVNPLSRTHRDRRPSLMPSMARMVAIVLPCSGPISSRSRDAAKEPAGQRPPEQPSNATDCHEKPRPPVRSVPRGEPPRRSPAHKIPRSSLDPCERRRRREESSKSVTRRQPQHLHRLAPCAPTCSIDELRGSGKGARPPNRTISAQATLVCHKMGQYTYEGGDADLVLPPNGARCCVGAPCVFRRECERNQRKGEKQRDAEPHKQTHLRGRLHDAEAGSGSKQSSPATSGDPPGCRESGSRRWQTRAQRRRRAPAES